VKTSQKFMNSNNFGVGSGKENSLAFIKFNIMLH
jgi:hypothetical protein